MKTFITLFFFTLTISSYAQTVPERSPVGGVQVMEQEELTGETDLQKQLQEAKENVKFDEENIQKAEEKKKDSESQVDIDDASIEKHKAQLQEDREKVKQIEEKMEAKKKKDK